MQEHILEPIYNASGAQSNFGGWHSYWYHLPLKLCGLLQTNGLTFVSKTATIEHRIGNTPYEGSKSLFNIQYNPMEWFPDSIHMQWFKANVLNKVGVGNPGLKAFLETGLWQKRGDKYVISYMCLEGNQIAQAKKAAKLFKQYKDELGDFIIEVNLSCPNTEAEQCALINDETKQVIAILAEVGVPIYVKVSVSMAPKSFMQILEDDTNVTAIVMSNTIIYGWQPEEDFYRDSNGNMPEIEWEKEFGKKSPLEDKAYDKKSGGLSGIILKYYVLKFIKNLRKLGFKKLIIGGGGILHPNDVDEYKEAGADSVFIGSVFMLRFWRVRSIIKRAHEIFPQGGQENEKEKV